MELYNSSALRDTMYTVCVCVFKQECYVTYSINICDEIRTPLLIFSHGLRCFPHVFSMKSNYSLLAERKRYQGRPVCHFKSALNVKQALSCRF